MFITLNHLLYDITTTLPKCSSMMFNEKLLHVAYSRFDNFLMLFMLPDTRASVKEIMLMNSEVIRFFEFNFGCVERALSEKRYVEQVDQFLFRCVFVFKFSVCIVFLCIIK